MCFKKFEDLNNELKDAWKRTKHAVTSQISLELVLQQALHIGTKSLIAAVVGSVCGTQVWKYYLENQPEFVRQAIMREDIKGSLLTMGSVGAIATGTLSSVATVLVERISTPEVTKGKQTNDNAVVSTPWLARTVLVSLVAIPFGVAAVAVVVRLRFS
jgi:hypothetical protein